MAAMTREQIQERPDKYSVPEPNSGCWLWVGGRTAQGYGETFVNGRVRYAHRVAYELHVGPIPAGLQLDHRCRVRSCINPRHLEPVTNRENTMRGLLGALRTPKPHCKKGHAFSEENTRRTPRQRVCLACERSRDRSAWIALRAERRRLARAI